MISNWKIVFSLFIVAMSCSQLNAVQFSDCGSVSGSWSKIQVTGCDDPDLDFCPFKRNTQVTLKLTFVPSNAVSRVTPVVHGIIGGLPVPFPLPNKNACVNSGLECPLKPGSTNTYEVAMPIQKVYPRLSLNIKLEIQDERNKDIACVIIPARIK